MSGAVKQKPYALLVYSDGLSMPTNDFSEEKVKDGNGGGGHGMPPGMEDLSRRVGRLEGRFDRFSDAQSEMIATLARMDERFARMDEKFENLAAAIGRLPTMEFIRQEISAASEKSGVKLKEVTDPIKKTGEDNKTVLDNVRIEIARLDERSKKVPTTTTVAGFLALATLIISLVGQWQNIGSYFGLTKSPESTSASHVKAVLPPPAEPSKPSEDAPKKLVG